jgi:ubiquinone/menaquinone biosynthesis C-methylase UbiE
MRQRLRGVTELLDAPRHDRRELEHSLDQVAEVNRLLGGRRAVWHALRPLLSRSDTTTILDVGTGSADIPVDIVRRARRADLRVAIIASDVHAQVRQIAAARTAGLPGIIVAAADALALPFDRHACDVVLLSMTLHHFDEAEQVVVLREAARVARRAVIINELERCTPNYLGARLLAGTRWRGNRLTRHDGPISVLRAFTMNELRDLAAAAGLHVHLLQRMFFYRIVLRADVSQ